MVTRSSLNRYSKAVDQAVEAARADLAAFWDTLPLDDPAACRDALIDFVPRLAAQYGDVAALAATEWYDSERDAAGIRSEYRATPGPSALPVQVEASVRASADHLWSDQQEKMLAALNGAIQMWVKDAGRNTILRNARRDPSNPRWARVPRGAKTCAFCTMLASRGWVYASEKTAGGAGNRFHHDCDCEIVPAFGDADPKIDGYDPDHLLELYNEARSAALESGDNPSDLNVLMRHARRATPSAYADGVKPRPQTT